MSERPTPEELADLARHVGSDPVSQFEGYLEDHGYVIVHPDDVRTREEGIVRVTWEESWDEHRWKDYYEPADDIDIRYVLEQVDKAEAALESSG